MRVIFATPAQQELVRTIEFYNTQAAGLAQDFIDEVDSAVQRIADFPRAGASYHHVSRNRTTWFRKVDAGHGLGAPRLRPRYSLSGGAPNMEIEEEEIIELSFRQIEELVDESARHLRKQLGVVLPRIARAPTRSGGYKACDPLGVHLPKGGLFYPCCGSDLDDAAESFGPSVTELHFADPCNPPQPNLRPRKDAVSVVTIPHIENVVLREPAHAREHRGTHSAHIHAKDGLLTLIDDVEALAVFYYRGDSYGEGGSNQRWLEPVLFHTVLARLLDGGLIVTDGSNCGSGKREIRVPWSALCGERAESTSFVYADRRFVFLGGIPGRRERVAKAWQVTANA